MKSIYLVAISILLFFSLSFPANGSRETDSYDGNIFPIYAGNGSIVPPQTNLNESLKNERISILFFYLDDSSDSKALAPLISGLDLIWRNNIDIIALTTDELQNKNSKDKNQESYYWNGNIPQTVIIDGRGNIQFDQDGPIEIDEVNKVISKTLGLDSDINSFSIESFNEYNSQISKK